MSTLAPYLYFKKHEEIDTGDSGDALGALKYTTNKFYRVNGSSTQLKGVESDIVLPSTYDYMDMLGETSLDNALPFDTIAAADYDKMNFVQPYLSELRTRSAMRTATNLDFTYVHQDIDQVKKLLGGQTISLNEQTRLKEADENEVRQKARDEELKSRKWPDEKIYEIGLEQAESNGLPAPLVISNGMVITNSAPAVAKDATGAVTNLTPDGSPMASAADDDAPDSPAKTALPGDPAGLPTEDRASLLEAERILVDYIALWNSGTALTEKPANN
jgi:C-terminal domain of tail specific protease (DUF3340)